MTGRSWFESRKVPLTTNLKNRVRGLKASSEKPDVVAAVSAAVAEMIRAAEKELARRETDDRFLVEVRHIGSVEDPNRVEALEAEESRAYELARLRSRKAIREQAGADSVDPEAVIQLTQTDPQWLEFQKKHAFQWLKDGLVNGEQEYRRLAELGGPSLLADAVVEVRAWQRIGFDQGEG